jgi:hypothetical protein
MGQHGRAVLRQLSTDLFAACDTIDHDADALGRAVNRIVASTHPVKRPDSKEATNAKILEHAVQTTWRLRNAGFASKCLFVADYARRCGFFASPSSRSRN